MIEVDVISDIYVTGKGRILVVNKKVHRDLEVGEFIKYKNEQFTIGAIEQTAYGFMIGLIVYPFNIERLRETGVIQTEITPRLKTRGFSTDRILNNRGLIGACIDEVLEYLMHNNKLIK